MFTTISITRPSLVDQLLEQFERTGALPSIGGGDHPPADPPADPPKDPKDPPADPPKDDDVTFDEKQQKKLNDLLAAERKKTEERLATEAAAQAQREKEQRERDEAEKRGEFETVKTSLTQERDTAISERDSLKSELDTYRELVRKDVEASWSEIPEEVRETYDGGDDDVLAKKQHMDRNAKIIERLTSSEKTTSGNPPNPPPGTPPGDVKIESPMTARQILS